MSFRFFLTRSGSRLAAGVCAALFAAGQNAVALSPERVEALRREAGAAVVRVEGTDRHGDLAGTGFFIDTSGTVATAYSVGGEAEGLVVSAGALRLPARRLAADKRSGVAFLKVDAETPALAVRDDLAPVGTEVAALGFPMGGGLESSAGRVVAHEIRNGGRFFATTHLRALVEAQPGMGGAPLLDEEGRVAGIVISKTESALGCFALPGRALLKARSDQLRFGGPRYGWLGIEIERIDPMEPNPAARVAAVTAGGPADRAGVLPGDVIRRVGATPVASAFDLLDATFFLTAGETVRMAVERDGGARELEVAVADASENPQAGGLRGGGLNAGMTPVKAGE